MGPPPGKPVTFYECHPDDHAPAPSVRADFHLVYHSHVQPQVSQGETCADDRKCAKISGMDPNYLRP